MTPSQLIEDINKNVLSSRRGIPFDPWPNVIPELFTEANNHSVNITIGGTLIDNRTSSRDMASPAKYVIKTVNTGDILCKGCIHNVRIHPHCIISELVQ